MAQRQPPKRQIAVKKKASLPIKRTDAEMADAYSQLWRSPYMRDTLGRANDVGMVATPLADQTTMAAYDPADRTIYANTLRDPRMSPMAGATPADTPSERNILTHEMGHAYGRSAFPSLRAPLLAPPPTGPQTKAEQTARTMLSQYGQTNEDEALANAYTNAASFLSETARDTSGFRNKLGEYEGNTPGAGAIVRDLLTGRAIYKQHPLRGVIR